MNKTKAPAEVHFHGRPGLIPQKLLRAVNITNEAKVIYGLLSTYKEAFPGQRWIAKHCSSSIPTVITRLRELEARGWLKREMRNRRKGETDIYHIYVNPLPLEMRREWVFKLRRSAKEINELSARDLLNEIELISFSQSDKDKKLEPLDAQNTKMLKTKNIAPPAQSPSSESVTTGKKGVDQITDEVIDYLNERAGTRFRHSEQSRKFIRARLKEGATIDDCRLVIDHRVAYWGEDVEMRVYLRPSTLFRPSHFEEYLVAAVRWVQDGKPPVTKGRQTVLTADYNQKLRAWTQGDSDG